MAAALPFAAIGMQALGSIVSGIGAYRQGQAEQSAAQYNATVSAQTANAATNVAAAKEASQRRASASALGDQAAAFAESGIGVGSASAQDVMRQSQANAELDALNIRYQGQLEHRAYKQQSVLDAYAAKQAGYNANAGLYAGFLGAGTQALTGAAMYKTKTGPWAGGTA